MVEKYKYQLDIIKDGVILESVHLLKNEYTFGRQGEIQLDHSSISRLHATLVYSEGWHIQDCNSTHGTFVNHKQITG